MERTFSIWLLLRPLNTTIKWRGWKQKKIWEKVSGMMTKISLARISFDWLASWLTATGDCWKVKQQEHFSVNWPTWEARPSISPHAKTTQKFFRSFPNFEMHWYCDFPSNFSQMLLMECSKLNGNKTRLLRKQDSRGNTALHIAVLNGKINNFKRILKFEELVIHTGCFDSGFIQTTLA